MKRPGYWEAIGWLARNDDCFWLKDEEPMISVSAALVCDLFDVAEAKVIRDLRRTWSEPKAMSNEELLKLVRGEQ